MKLSIVIPCRNEAEGIAETVNTLVHELDAARLDYEVVAVDDGSTDGTGEVLRRVAAQFCGEQPRCSHPELGTRHTHRLRIVTNEGEHGLRDGRAMRNRARHG